MSSISRELEYENSQVLSLVQAMLGAISSNFRRVSIKCGSQDDIHISFYIAVENAEDREEIDDIVFEFEALQLTGVKISYEVFVSDGELPVIIDYQRMVFARREVEG